MLKFIKALIKAFFFTHIKNIIPMTINYLQTLKYSWTALVELDNGQIITIWWTALQSTKETIRYVISVSSDYPKSQIIKY